MNFGSISQSALEAIRKNGTPVTLLKPSEQVYNPLTGAYTTGVMLQWDTMGVILPVSKRTAEDDGFNFDDLTLSSMRKVLVGSIGDVEPAQGDTLAFNGAYWRIEEKTTLQPDGKTTMLHICYAQRMSDIGVPALTLPVITSAGVITVVVGSLASYFIEATQSPTDWDVFQKLSDATDGFYEVSISSGNQVDLNTFVTGTFFFVVTATNAVGTAYKTIQVNVIPPPP